MATIWVELRYRSGMEYSESISVNKVCAKKAGSQAEPNRLAIELQSAESKARLYVSFEPESAIPLARAILDVAKGYVSAAELELA